MKLIAPDYYTQFRCIAELCKHSCCIGWEIDIDKDTHDFYKAVTGDFGKRLSENISCEGEVPCFKLGENERCPFLNKDNLCDIILELGEGALCQICSDHPRFRNFYDDRIEIGLGLCCEAAAKLILDNKEKVTMIEIENDEDNSSSEDEWFFDFRDGIFDILQDRNLSADERIDKILCKHDISLPGISISEWADFFLGLERLDDKWEEMLLLAKSSSPVHCEIDDIILEQLLVYFVYRHLSDGIFDGRLKERLAFSVLSVYIIRTVSAVCSDIYDVSRMYSSEIEYSEENIEAILNMLSEESE